MWPLCLEPVVVNCKHEVQNCEASHSELNIAKTSHQGVVKSTIWHNTFLKKEECASELRDIKRPEENGKQTQEDR